MKVIFLDIDGVLNNGETGYDAWNLGNIFNLQKILAKTEAKIVLSSSWRHDLIETLRHFECASVDLPVSFTQTRKSFDRGAEIALWLEQYGDKVDRYCIIDDDIDDINEYFPKDVIVHTDFQFGLSENDAKKAIEILNRK